MLYSKAIITRQSRYHCKAILIQEAVSHSGVEVTHEKKSISELAEVKWAGVIADGGSVVPGTLGVFLWKKDWSREKGSRLPRDGELESQCL